MNIIAKCYTPNWAVTLNEIGEKGCIGADVSLLDNMREQDF